MFHYQPIRYYYNYDVPSPTVTRACGCRSLPALRCPARPVDPAPGCMPHVSAVPHAPTNCHALPLHGDLYHSHLPLPLFPTLWPATTLPIACRYRRWHTLLHWLVGIHCCDVRCDLLTTFIWRDVVLFSARVRAHCYPREFPHLQWPVTGHRLFCYATALHGWFILHCLHFTVVYITTSPHCANITLPVPGQPIDLPHWHYTHHIRYSPTARRRAGERRPSIPAFCTTLLCIASSSAFCVCSPQPHYCSWPWFLPAVRWRVHLAQPGPTAFVFVCGVPFLYYLLVFTLCIAFLLIYPKPLFGGSHTVTVVRRSGVVQALVVLWCVVVVDCWWFYCQLDWCAWRRWHCKPCLPCCCYWRPHWHYSDDVTCVILTLLVLMTWWRDIIDASTHWPSPVLP